MISKNMNTLTELDAAIVNESDSSYVDKLLQELTQHKRTISNLAKTGSNSAEEMESIYALQSAIDCAERILTIKL